MRQRLGSVKCSHPTTDSQQGTREGFLDGRATLAGSCSEEGLLRWEMVEGPPRVRPMEGTEPRCVAGAGELMEGLQPDTICIGPLRDF